MYHDATLAPRADADPRPQSAVSSKVGLVGLAGLLAWTAVALWFRLDGPYAAMVNVAAAALPMVLWAVLVDKVHRNPTTGIDWSAGRPLKETLDISLTKLAGLWLTWAGIAVIYAVGRFYWQGGFAFAMQCAMVAAPALFVLSVPYTLWIDRYLVQPKDGSWMLGAWLMGLKEPIEWEPIWNHLRGWAVKAFFLAFMLAILPAGFGDFVRWDLRGILDDPVRLSMWLITFMFVIDVAFATGGYMLTLRPLDSHIRTANPLPEAWLAALACYPPFALMATGQPLDYHIANADWNYWLAGHPVILTVFGAVLVGLTAIYAWATMAFGYRFSNLTHRGIITNGPYAFSRHPAYLSKNLFWWISGMPFLVTNGSWVDAVRNTVLMGVVSGIYYWRARTEEKHLGMDPAYRDYSQWMARNGAVPRFFAWVAGTKRGD